MITSSVERLKLSGFELTKYLGLRLRRTLADFVCYLTDNIKGKVHLTFYLL